MVVVIVDSGFEWMWEGADSDYGQFMDKTHRKINTVVILSKKMLSTF